MDQRVAITIFVFLLYIAHAQSLRCYACFGTGPENECEKYGTYVEAMSGDRDTLKKNCTSPHDKVCIQETFIDRGNTISHIRDCSDNETFSFSASDLNLKGAYKRLEDLQNNNETSCVFDGLRMVCLAKCDEDFCNGPILTETNGSDVIRLPMTALVVAVAHFVLFLI